MGRIYTSRRVSVSGGTPTLRDLPGLRWWVQPSGIVSTTAVDSWTDASGNGFTTSETGANRPTLVTSALNGFSGIQTVTATAQRLKRDATNLLVTDSFTAGFIVRFDALPGTSNDVYFGNVDDPGGNSGFEFGRVGATNKYTVPSLSVKGSQSSSNTIATGLFHRVMYTVDDVHNGVYWFDGAITSYTNPLLGAGTTAAGSAGRLTLGCRNNLTVHASMTMIEGFVCSQWLKPETMLQINQIWKNTYPDLP